MASNNFKISVFSTILVLIPILGYSQVGLDERLNTAFMPVAVWWENLIFTSVSLGVLDIPIVLILLLFGASFFTVYFGFINIRKFPLAIQVVRGWCQFFYRVFWLY